MEKYELTGLALQVTLGTVSCHDHMTIVKVAMEGWVVGNFAKCNVISLPRFSFWVNENKWLYQKQNLICCFSKKGSLGRYRGASQSGSDARRRIHRRSDKLESNDGPHRRRISPHEDQNYS
jgi:hypothetical protein